MSALSPASGLEVLVLVMCISLILAVVWNSEWGLSPVPKPGLGSVEGKCCIRPFEKSWSAVSNDSSCSPRLSWLAASSAAGVLSLNVP